MEEICYLLCAKLNEDGKGGYGIFYGDELEEALPEDSRNRHTLEAALKKLENEGYIDVRYSRGDALCIALIKPYPCPDLHFEPEIEEYVPTVEAGQDNRQNRLLFMLCALCAFAGALVGVFAAEIILAVV